MNVQTSMLFPIQLTKVMTTYRYASQSNFGRKLGKDRNYIHDLLRGERSATPQFIDKLIETFSIQEPLRTDLYRAAAMDRGYKINIGRQ